MNGQTDRQTDKAATGTSRATSCRDFAATINVVLDEKLRVVLYFYMDRVQCCLNKEKEEEKGRTLRKKNLKLQPYFDFWASEVEWDFSCPAHVLFRCVSLSVPRVSPPAFLCVLSRPLHSLLPRFPLQPCHVSIFWNVDVLLVDTVHE